MGAREDRIQQIVESVRRRRTRRADRAVRALLRVAPDGDGLGFMRALAEALQEPGRPCLHFDLPEYHLDAGERVLGKLCQTLDPAHVLDIAWDARRSVHERIAAVTRALVARPGEMPAFALYVPRSWFRQPADPRRSLSDNPRSILEALLQPGFDAMVAAGSTPTWLEQQMEAVSSALPSPEAGPAFLHPFNPWTRLAPLWSEATRLAQRVGKPIETASPLAVRLGVACEALGYDAVGQAFQKPAPYFDLVAWLREQARAHPGWTAGLHRLMIPRFPVDEELMATVTGELSDPGRVLSRCLVRQDAGLLQAEETLRAILGPQRTPEPTAHEHLWRRSAEADGAPTPRDAAERGTLLDLLEAEHHRAHMGPGAPEGPPSRRLSRLIQYERAWSWSVEFKEHAAAAEVYRSILEEDPGDAYSHHYRAWNLDQAGREGPVARQEYEAAIGLEQDNPWFNSRYITFLRDNGFRGDAHRAWEEAKRRVIRGRWARRLDIPRHFHRWIAQSALDAGDLVLARDVLDALTPPDFQTHVELRRLREQLLQGEEIRRFGEPVYPARVRVADRWGAPRLLPPAIRPPARSGRRAAPAEAELRAFYPGRVESIEGRTVTLVLARPEDRTLFTVTVDRERLVAMASGIPPKVGRFLEYGDYGNDLALVWYHRPLPPRPTERQRFEHGLRYLHDGAAQEPA